MTVVSEFEDPYGNELNKTDADIAAAQTAASIGAAAATGGLSVPAQIAIQGGIIVAGAVLSHVFRKRKVVSSRPNLPKQHNLEINTNPPKRYPVGDLVIDGGVLVWGLNKQNRDATLVSDRVDAVIYLAEGALPDPKLPEPITYYDPDKDTGANEDQKFFRRTDSQAAPDKALITTDEGFIMFIEGHYIVMVKRMIGDIPGLYHYEPIPSSFFAGSVRAYWNNKTKPTDAGYENQFEPLRRWSQADDPEWDDEGRDRELNAQWTDDHSLRGTTSVHLAMNFKEEGLSYRSPSIGGAYSYRENTWNNRRKRTLHIPSFPQLAFVYPGLTNIPNADLSSPTDPQEPTANIARIFTFGMTQVWGMDESAINKEKMAEAQKRADYQRVLAIEPKLWATGQNIQAGEERRNDTKLWIAKQAHTTSATNKPPNKDFWIDHDPANAYMPEAIEPWSIQQDAKGNTIPIPDDAIRKHDGKVWINTQKHIPTTFRQKAGPPKSNAPSFWKEYKDITIRPFNFSGVLTANMDPVRFIQSIENITGGHVAFQGGEVYLHIGEHKQETPQERHVETHDLWGPPTVSNNPDSSTLINSVEGTLLFAKQSQFDSPSPLPRAADDDLIEKDRVPVIESMQNIEFINDFYQGQAFLRTRNLLHANRRNIVLPIKRTEETQKWSTGTDITINIPSSGIDQIGTDDDDNPIYPTFIVEDVAYDPNNGFIVFAREQNDKDAWELGLRRNYQEIHENFDELQTGTITTPLISQVLKSSNYIENINGKKNLLRIYYNVILNLIDQPINDKSYDIEVQWRPDIQNPNPDDLPEPGFGGLTASYNVEEVSDGDTIVVSGFNGNARTNVRLIGIDTPETVHPTKPEQYFGTEASARTKELLENKRVHLVLEYAGINNERNYDDYDRLLAYVILPNGDPDDPTKDLFINLQLVKEGYARVIDYYPFRHLNLFLQAQRAAQTPEIRPPDDPNDPDAPQTRLRFWDWKTIHRENIGDFIDHGFFIPMSIPTYAEDHASFRCRLVASDESRGPWSAEASSRGVVEQPIPVPSGVTARTIEDVVRATWYPAEFPDYKLARLTYGEDTRTDQEIADEEAIDTSTPISQVDIYHPGLYYDIPDLDPDKKYWLSLFFVSVNNAEGDAFITSFAKVQTQPFQFDMTSFYQPVLTKDQPIGTAPPFQLPEAIGGQGDITYEIDNTVVSGLNGLPDGTQFNATSRRIIDTPTKGGEFNFGYKATDSSDPARSIFIVVTVNVFEEQVQPFQFNMEGFFQPVLTKGQAIGTAPPFQLPEAVGGQGDITYEIDNTVISGLNGIPDGTTFGDTNRRVTGTPTKAGEFNFGYKATDSSDTPRSIFIVVTVNVFGDDMPVQLSFDAGVTVLDFVKDQEIEETILPAATGLPQITYELQENDLPNGLAFASSTRTLSGTPTELGNFLLSYRAYPNDRANFVAQPLPAISGGSGSGATVTSLVVSNGSITEINFSPRGTGFVAGDVITFTQGNVSGTYMLSASNINQRGGIKKLSNINITGVSSTAPSLTGRNYAEKFILIRVSEKDITQVSFPDTDKITSHNFTRRQAITAFRLPTATGPADITYELIGTLTDGLTERTGRMIGGTPSATAASETRLTYRAYETDNPENFAEVLIFINTSDVARNAPGLPERVQNSTTNTSRLYLEILWNASERTGVGTPEYYQWRYREAPASTAPGQWNYGPQLPSVGLRAIIPNLRPGTRYEVAMLAGNAAGQSAWSANVVMNTLSRDDLRFQGGNRTIEGVAGVALPANTIRLPDATGGSGIGSGSYVFSVEQKPPWMDIDLDTRYVTGTPTIDDYGAIVWKVQNQAGEEAELSITYFVAPPPTVQPLTFAQGDTHINAQTNNSALDPVSPRLPQIVGDQSKITYSVSSEFPDWLSFDATTRQVSIKQGRSVPALSYGLITFLYTGTHTDKRTASRTIVVSVSPATVTPAEAIERIGPWYQSALDRPSAPAAQSTNSRPNGWSATATNPTATNSIWELTGQRQGSTGNYAWFIRVYAPRLGGAGATTTEQFFYLAGPDESPIFPQQTDTQKVDEDYLPDNPHASVGTFEVSHHAAANDLYVTPWRLPRGKKVVVSVQGKGTSLSISTNDIIGKGAFRENFLNDDFIAAGKTLDGKTFYLGRGSQGRTLAVWFGGSSTTPDPNNIEINIGIEDDSDRYGDPVLVQAGNPFPETTALRPVIWLIRRNHSSNPLLATNWTVISKARQDIEAEGRSAFQTAYFLTPEGAVGDLPSLEGQTDEQKIDFGYLPSHLVRYEAIPTQANPNLWLATRNYTDDISTAGEWAYSKIIRTWDDSPRLAQECFFLSAEGSVGDLPDLSGQTDAQKTDIHYRPTGTVNVEPDPTALKPIVWRAKRVWSTNPDLAVEWAWDRPVNRFETPAIPWSLPSHISLDLTEEEVVNATFPEASNIPSGTTLTYSVEGTFPDSLAFTASTRKVAGTIAEGEARSRAYILTYKATDSADATRFATSTVYVNVTQDDPSIRFPAFNSIELTGGRATATAIDLPKATGGSGTLAYSHRGLPNGLSINNATQKLSGTPPNTFEILSIEWTATDGTDTATIRIPLIITPALTDTTAPAFTVNQSSEYADLAFTLPTGSVFAHIEWGALVDADDDPQTADVFQLISSVNITSNKFRIPDLDPSTKYRVQVQYSDYFGNSTGQTSKDFTTNASTTDIEEIGPWYRSGPTRPSPPLAQSASTRPAGWSTTATNPTATDSIWVLKGQRQGSTGNYAWVIDVYAPRIAPQTIGPFYRRFATSPTLPDAQDDGTTPTGWSTALLTPTASQSVYVLTGNRAGASGNYAWEIAVYAPKTGADIQRIGPFYQSSASRPSAPAAQSTNTRPNGWNALATNPTTTNSIWVLTGERQGSTGNYVWNIEVYAPRIAADSLQIIGPFYRRFATSPTLPSAQDDGTTPTDWQTTTLDPTATESTYILTGSRIGSSGNYTWEVSVYAPKTGLIQTIGPFYRRAASRPSNPSGQSNSNTPTNWSGSVLTPTRTNNVWVLTGQRQGSSGNYAWILELYAPRTGTDIQRIGPWYQSAASRPSAPTAQSTNTRPNGWNATATNPTATNSIWVLTGERQGSTGNYAWIIEVYAPRLGSTSIQTIGPWYLSAASRPSPPPAQSNNNRPAAWSATATNPTATNSIWVLTGERQGNSGNYAWRIEVYAPSIGVIQRIGPWYQSAASRPAAPAAQSTNTRPTGWSTTGTNPTATNAIWRLTGERQGNTGNYAWTVDLYADKITPVAPVLPVFSQDIADYQVIVNQQITPITLPAATLSGSGTLDYSLSRSLPSSLSFAAATRRITGAATDVRQWTATLTATVRGTSRRASIPIIINTIPPDPVLT